MHNWNRDTVRLLAAAVLLLVLIPAIALAKPEIELKQTATKQTTVVENGQTVVRQVPAEEAAPGETVLFTLAVSNRGDEAATNLVFDNPIPAEAAYTNGSAKGENAEITFSIDGGKSYKMPAMLTYELTLPDGRVEKRVASPEQYTHLRWTVPTLPQGTSTELQFSATIRKQ